MTTRESEPCPCGSGHSLGNCCGPLLAGLDAADNAEQLMRSRYTAYTLGDEAYLLRTWHASTRPECLQLDSDPRPDWQGLRIIRSEAGRAGDTRGSVEFEAACLIAGKPGRLHENSRFVREAGVWFYLDGDVDDSPPEAGTRVSRNQPCPCGSGRKFKRCCGA